MHMQPSAAIKDPGLVSHRSNNSGIATECSEHVLVNSFLFVAKLFQI